MFNPEQPKAVGTALVELAEGVSDGMDMGDMANAMNLMTAFAGAIDEFQGDKDAAILFMLEGAAHTLANKRLDPPAPPLAGA